MGTMLTERNGQIATQAAVVAAKIIRKEGNGAWPQLFSQLREALADGTKDWFNIFYSENAIFIQKNYFSQKKFFIFFSKILYFPKITNLNHLKGRNRQASCCLVTEGVDQNDEE